MTDESTIQASRQIPTNQRLLLLLEEVASTGAPVSSPALVSALGLPRPTVHRLLHTAETSGFLQRNTDGRSYSPGPRLRQLSINTLAAQQLRTARLLVLKSLAHKVGETCNLAAPDGDCMTYIDRVETHWRLRIQLPVGTQVPLHCTASGKLYLSTLPKTKLRRLLAHIPLERHTACTKADPDSLADELGQTHERGFSTDDQEFMTGMAAVAVPVRDDAGRLLTTLSVHAPVQRQPLEALIGYIPELRHAAAALEDLARD